MGNIIEKIRGSLNELLGIKKNVRILLLGLDAAGKTTILNKLHCGEVVSTIPTLGFNVETLKYKGLTITMWDVGGQTTIRRLWRYYYENTDAVIYAVDASDSQRFDEARDELHDMLQDERLEDSALLVLANKQDLPNSVSTAGVADALELNLLRQRRWWTQATCALNGEGLYEGLDWLASEIDGRRKK